MLSLTEQKFSEKNFRGVVQTVQFYFEISHLNKILEQNFYLCVAVYVVRIWTYKNADEKAHTFSRRSKNERKTDTV